MTVSTDGEKKLLTKIYLHNNFTRKIGTAETHNILKAIYEKTSANIILNVKKLEPIPLNSETREGYSLSPLLFNIVFKVLAGATSRQRN